MRGAVRAPAIRRTGGGYRLPGVRGPRRADRGRARRRGRRQRPRLGRRLARRRRRRPRYRHPLFGRWAAVTRREVGLGTITTVGIALDRATLAFVMTDAAAHGLLGAMRTRCLRTWRPPPFCGAPGLGHRALLLGAQGRVWVVHNWSPRAARSGSAVAECGIRPRRRGAPGGHGGRARAPGRAGLARGAPRHRIERPSS